MPKTKEYKIIGVLDPGQTFVMKVIIPMAQIREHLPLLTSGQRAVFVFGWIEYRDAFNVDRYRSFRYIIDFSDGLRDRNLIMCENGNEAN